MEEKKEEKDLKEQVGKEAKETEKTSEFKVVKPEKGKTENKKNKHKVLKTILILVAIIALIYAIIVIRNHILLKEIMKKTAQYEGITNYHYMSTYFEEGEPIVNIGQSQKGDIIEVMIEKNGGNKASLSWLNKKTNEGVTISLYDRIAYIKKAEDIIYLEQMPNFYIEDTSYLNSISLTSFIYTEKSYDKEYYVIYQLGKSIRLDKETGLLVQKELGTSLDENGVRQYSFILYDNWKINEVTDKEMEKPNLEEYKVIESENK